MEEYRNVLVLGETENGSLSSITKQALGIGRKLADDMGQKLHLLFLGRLHQIDGDQGYRYGADKVCVASEPLLDNYVTESHLAALEQIVNAQKPRIVLLGQTDKGMDLAPRLAFRLKTGVTLDCVELRIDETTEALKQVKPVFGGKAQCCYHSKGSGPQIVTIRDRAFEGAVYDDSRSGEAEHINVSLDVSKFRTRLLEKRADESLSLAQQLLSAQIVVSGGRCLAGKKGFDILKETARLLGGSIAGSRPSVDHGWIPHSLQVGLTGQKIAPELYFAVGISGAIQHMAGCLKSKTIISINIDEEAPIFRFSHYGVVGDYKEVLQGFNDESKNLR